MEDQTQRQLQHRLEARIRDWSVAVEKTLETETSLVAFGRRDDRPVVLKVLRQPGDEWLSGEVLEAFDGNGVVRVYGHVEGAVLLERLIPGHPLVRMVLDGRDDEAGEVLAGVVRRMSAHRLPPTCPTVRDWGQGFDRYLASGDGGIPRDLVDEARRTYRELCASQRAPRLLHGDLQHHNVLFDQTRGWLAIDPKGVVGEIEYEIGAILRNPIDRPDLFASPAIVQRRLVHFTTKLGLDRERVLAWTFAQAVLSAIWTLEEGHTVSETRGSMMLADAIRPLPDLG